MFGGGLEESVLSCLLFLYSPVCPKLTSHYNSQWSVYLVASKLELQYGVEIRKRVTGQRITSWRLYGFAAPISWVVGVAQNELSASITREGVTVGGTLFGGSQVVCWTRCVALLQVWAILCQPCSNPRSQSCCRSKSWKTRCNHHQWYMSCRSLLCACKLLLWVSFCSKVMHTIWFESVVVSNDRTFYSCLSKTVSLSAPIREPVSNKLLSPIFMTKPFTSLLN